jgi:hypothetical protein
MGQKQRPTNFWCQIIQNHPKMTPKAILGKLDPSMVSKWAVLGRKRVKFMELRTLHTRHFGFFTKYDKPIKLSVKNCPGKVFHFPKISTVSGAIALQSCPLLYAGSSSKSVVFCRKCYEN